MFTAIIDNNLDVIGDIELPLTTSKMQMVDTGKGETLHSMVPACMTTGCA